MTHHSFVDPRAVKPQRQLGPPYTMASAACCKRSGWWAAAAGAAAMRMGLPVVEGGGMMQEGAAAPPCQQRAGIWSCHCSSVNLQLHALQGMRELRHMWCLVSGLQAACMGFPHVFPEYKWLYIVPPHEGVKGRWAGIQDGSLLRDGCVKGWPPLLHGEGRGLELSAPNRSPTSRDGFLQLLLHGGVKGW